MVPTATEWGRFASDDGQWLGNVGAVLDVADMKAKQEEWRKTLSSGANPTGGQTALRRTC